MTAPKLRFKEFDGDWIATQLGNVAYKPQYGMNSSAKEFDGENKYLRITDINENDNSFDLTKITSPDDNLEDKYLLKEGDLLFARTGASVGKSYLYTNKDGKVYFAGFLIKFSLKDLVNPYFIFTQTLSKKFSNWVITNSMRSGQPGINAEEYSLLPITICSKEEQTKIASFLSAVDQKISQLSQKHELLNQYKQGMMQKLFSQQIRFKADDGSEFGEWEEKLLSEIGTFKNGLNKDKESFGFGSPFINLMDVFGKKVVQTDKLGLVDVNQKDLENYDLIKGDVLFIRSSVKAEGVGQTALITDDLPNTVYSGFLIRFRDSYGLDLGFKKYCFMNNDFRLRLLAKSTTSANTNINQESLSALTINIPCLEEQSKIANFLSAIDQKIEVVAQQIEQAKQWKKGLLQQMFV